MFLFSLKHCLLSPTFTGNWNMDSAELQQWEMWTPCKYHLCRPQVWESEFWTPAAGVRVRPQPETEQQKCMMEPPKACDRVQQDQVWHHRPTRVQPHKVLTQVQEATNSPWRHDICKQNSRTPDLVTAESPLQMLNHAGILMQINTIQMRLCSVINWLFALNPSETVQLLTEEKWRTTVLKEY